MPDGAALLASAPVPVSLQKVGSLSINRLLFRQRRAELLCSLQDGKLKIVVREPWKIRHIQTANLVSEAIAVLGVTALPRFYINTDDSPYGQSHPITVFGNCSVNGHADCAAPDFSFNGWPEARFADFDAKVRQIAAASEVAARDNRAFWAGVCNNSARATLVRISQRNLHAIEAVEVVPNHDLPENRCNVPFKPMEEQAAEYRYMVDVEGVGFSGRLKLLLHAARVVLVVDRPYREFFFKDMEPFRHYVPVARDSSDLVERIDWLRSNPLREAEIVREAQHFARTRLTRKAAIEKWAELLEEHRKAGGKLKSGVEHLPRADRNFAAAPREKERVGG